MATHYLPLHQIFIFQHTLTYPIYPPPCRFNTATRRWLVAALNQAQTAAQFQHAAARRRLQRVFIAAAVVHIVSTHSHPKLAGPLPSDNRRSWCFNTQHPEGGWQIRLRDNIKNVPVSTHSHPKVAGGQQNKQQSGMMVSTHSRLKAAGKHAKCAYRSTLVSTHSRLKAAGTSAPITAPAVPCFNTQPPEGGWAVHFSLVLPLNLFQHTAA